MNTKVKISADEQQKNAAAREELKIAELKAKVSRAFDAPEFDKNSFAASMIAAGKDFMEILAAVNEAQKKWNKEHPAPLYSFEIIKKHILDNYSNEFETLCGCKVSEATNEVWSVDVETNSLTSTPLETSATVSQIITAIFSVRTKAKYYATLAQKQADAWKTYFSAIMFAVQAQRKLGIDNARMMQDLEAAQAAAQAEASEEREAAKIDAKRLFLNIFAAQERYFKVCATFAKYATFESDDYMEFSEATPKLGKAKVCKLNSDMRTFASSIKTCEAMIKIAIEKGEITESEASEAREAARLEFVENYLASRNK